MVVRSIPLTEVEGDFSIWFLPNKIGTKTHLNTERKKDEVQAKNLARKSTD